MEILELIYQFIIVIGILFMGMLAYGVWKSTDIIEMDDDIELETQDNKKNKYTNYIIYKNLRK